MHDSTHLKPHLDHRRRREPPLHRAPATAPEAPWPPDPIPGRVSPISDHPVVPQSTSQNQTLPKSPLTPADSEISARDEGNLGLFDVRLNLKGKNGRSLVLELGSDVLIANSPVFADLISDHRKNLSGLCRIEVPDVENLNVFRETIELMFEEDIQKKLLKIGVFRAIDILEVSAGIKFGRGVSSCLKYLEAVPWTEEEEEKLRDLLPKLNVDDDTATDVDNINWLVDILLDHQMAEDFADMWANQGELLKMHHNASPMVRYELSRVSALLFIALGTRKLHCPSETRLKLLQVWFSPMLSDFGWLQRCKKGLDMKALEEAMGQALLTLPLKEQYSLFMDWFQCFSKHGSECPNLSKSFQIWWRRSFLRGSETFAIESR
ncbi:UNVERIFIED_CONTAM: BTB/POZ domain-containing protein [Sesamum angustifolium]|uniref:BTB/POZ domain-containing protein n=1 Tax=Sesamum angustifolium TaxID=2727405 RepID=A0AAW2NHJ3_9LAMI